MSSYIGLLRERQGPIKNKVRSFGIYLSILVLEHVINSAVAYGDSI